MSTKILDILNPSAFQLGALFHHLHDPEDPYVIQNEIVLNSLIDPVAIQGGLEYLTAKHDALRSVILHRDLEQPRLVVLAEQKTEFQFYDLTEYTESEQRLRFEKFRMQDAQRGFQLHRGPLIRLVLFKTGADTQSNEYRLLSTSHHIIMDGWCVGVFFKELIAFSQLASSGGAKPARDRSFSHFLQWLDKKDSDADLAYWHTKLSPLKNFETQPQSPRVSSSKCQTEELMPSRLPFLRPSHTGNRPHSLSMPVKPELHQRIRTLAKEWRVTTNALLQSAWAVAVGQYSDSDDIIFGTVFSGRPEHIEGIESSLGAYINTLPVYCRLANESFEALTRQVHLFYLESLPHQHVSLTSIQHMLNRQDALFDHLFVYQNFDNITNQGSATNAGDINVIESIWHERTNYPLTLVVHDNDTLTMRVKFDSACIQPGQAERLAAHWIGVLEQIVTQPYLQILQINLLTEKERHQVLLEFNSTQYPLPANQNVITDFLLQLNQYPEQCAVVDGQRQLSYRQLNAMTDVVAIWLQQRSCQMGEIIGILADNSIELVFAMLGILKTGAAFLPIDPKQPSNRIINMLSQARVRILLTESNETGEVIKVKLPDVLVKPLSSLKPASAEQTLVELPRIAPDDLAYVIFTSGSTGEPKGVPIHHAAILNLCRWHRKAFGVDRQSNTTKYASPGFDASVWEVFPTLCSGATLYIVPEEFQVDMKRLRQFFNQHAITQAFLPTAVCETFIQIQAEQLQPVETLRVLLTGGDILRAAACSQNYRLFNNYGPTENAVVSTYAEVTMQSDPIPIGRPIDNSQVYVLNRQLLPSPIGVPGDIYLSGIGLSSGYLHKPGLTQQVFLENPLNGKVMYKSGDRGYWGDDGNLYYLGREDGQIQRHGQRIEYGEIESVAKELPIYQSKAQLLGPSLWLFYVTRDEVSAQEAVELEQALLTLLKDRLPGYMVPTHLQKLSRLPLTVNDKVDISVLASYADERQINVSSDTQDSQLQFSWTLLQLQALEGISRETGVAIERLKPTDNFFSLGGDSIRAMRLVAYIQKHFQIELDVAHVFRNPQLKNLLAPLHANTTAQYRAEPVPEPAPYIPDQGSRRNRMPLTSEQARFYFLGKLGKTTSYNVPLLFKLPEDFPRNELKYIFHALIHRHCSLRTLIRDQEGVLEQEVQTTITLPLTQLKLEHWDRLQITALVQPFDLTKEIPIRLILVDIDADHYLLFDIHHIAIDQGSMAILVQDFLTLAAGQTPPEQTIDYLDYCSWRRQLTAQPMDTAQNFWREQLKGANQVTLLTDFIRPQKKSMHGETIIKRWSATDKQRIEQYCRHNGWSPFVFILSALAITIHKFTGDQDLIIGTPVDLRRYARFESVLGLLTSTMPVRLFPDSEQPIAHMLNQTHSTIANCLRFSDLPFERIVELSDEEKGLSHNPLFDIMLVVREALSRQMQDSPIKLLPVDLPRDTAKFDLLFDIGFASDGIDIQVEYSIDLYRLQTVQQLLDTLHRISMTMIENDTVKLRDIDAIGSAQYDFLVFGNNMTARPFDTKLLLHEQLSHVAQAGLHPTDAIIDRRQSYALSDWEQQANRLAHYLKGLGVGRHSKIAILMQRSFTMMVGIMAAMKAGGAFVPLNPDDPQSKLAQILKLSRCTVLLTDQPSAPPLGFQGELLDISSIDLCNLSIDAPERINTASDPAVIIHTSGSTGAPKGVVISHRMLINALHSMQHHYPLHANDVYLFKTPIVFDVSFTELFSFLMGQGRVVLMASREERDPALILQYLRRYGVTHINFVPSMLDAFLNHPGQSTDALSTLKYLFAAGEKLLPATAHRIAEYRRDITLVNIYGPSETFYTTHCVVDLELYRKSDPASQPMQSIPIGRPFENLSIYLLDGQQLVPWGAIGELCVSGIGVASGYLDQDMEKDHFVPNPFQPDTRMYRTGDMARFRDDGQLEYHGRRDRQVKIAGRRVECAEIEHAILSLPGITQAVVRAWPEDGSGDIKLYAYLNINDETGHEQTQPMSVEHIRQALVEKLPQPLLPAGFIAIENFPYTASGKIDIRQLPAPEVTPQRFEPPQRPDTEIQIRMQTLWAVALEVPTQRIGKDDDFFGLGGTSLGIIRLVALIKKHFDIELSVESLFQHRTLADMAKQVETGSHEQQPSTPVTMFGPAISPTSLVCIPGINGHAMMFKDLANVLISTQFICMEPIDLLGNRLVPLDSMDSLCHAYLQALKQRQTQGPYYFLGHSSGGFVALQLAHWLASQGQTVAHVFLLDTYCSIENKNRDWVISQYSMSPLSASYIEHIFAGFERYLGKSLGLNQTKLSDMTESQRLRHIARQLVQYQVIPSEDVDFVRRYLLNRHIHKKLMSEVFVGNQRIRYQGKVSLIKAQDLLPNQALDHRQDYGWGEYLTGQLTILTTEGNHESLMSGLNATELAKHLNTLINADLIE